jgi:hypothetical protein
MERKHLHPVNAELLKSTVYRTTKITEEQERRSQSETQTLSPSTLNLARKSGTTISEEEENTQCSHYDSDLITVFEYGKQITPFNEI